LGAYGLRFCRESIAHSEERALEAATALGFPVVLKTARPDVLHKTEAGGVIVGLRSEADLRDACRSIAGRTGSTDFLVQEQISRGCELLAGGRRDETFGPLVAIGIGGVLTEVVRDVSLGLAPLSLDAARSLVPLGLRGRLMSGYRDVPSWEAETVARALMGIGRVLADHPRVREI